MRSVPSWPGHAAALSTTTFPIATVPAAVLAVLAGVRPPRVRPPRVRPLVYGPFGLARCRRGRASGVDAALGLGGPRPPAAARVGPVGHPGRAGPAADRWIAVVDERVHQDVVGGDVVIDLLLGPFHDGVDLEHLPPRVPLDDLGVMAGVCLLP